MGFGTYDLEMPDLFGCKHPRRGSWKGSDLHHSQFEPPYVGCYNLSSLNPPSQVGSSDDCDESREGSGQEAKNQNEQRRLEPKKPEAESMSAIATISEVMDQAEGDEYRDR